MLNRMLDQAELTKRAKKTKRAGLVWMAIGALAVLSLTGCETASSIKSKPAGAAAVAAGTNETMSLTLMEGDTIKISFPGAPTLDTVQTVRRDGKISLEMVGEYDAAGKTPAQVEDDLKKLYAAQIVNNTVSVTVQSSAFVVYVMGAVLKPGRIVSDRRLTPLQALIEAGVDDSRANLKSVQVIRTDDQGHTQKFKLNLYKVLHNTDAPMPDFTLLPYDTINVPERFSFY